MTRTLVNLPKPGDMIWAADYWNRWPRDSYMGVVINVIKLDTLQWKVEFLNRGEIHFVITFGSNEIFRVNSPPPCK